MGVVLQHLQATSCCSVGFNREKKF